MITDNSKTIRLIKRIFYPGAIMMAIATLILIFTGKDLFALICGVVLIIWFLAFQTADFEYIQFVVEDNKIVLRYYQVIKFGRKDYQSIEFPVKTLHNFVIEKSLFGLVNDLTLVIKTRSGIAEYPSISLAAVKKADQLIIEQTLKELLQK
jgi:hypothetical protein